MNPRILRLLALLVVASFFAAGANAALTTRNVFLITTDGLRWQEVFGGAEEALLSDKAGTGNPERMKQLFWKPTPEERRKTLLPFFWSEIAAHGQLYGNRLKDSEARVTNGKNFSYPGYNEFLTGDPNPRGR